MNKHKLEEMVEQTIRSMDDAQRAEPAPFLLTRINVRMRRETSSPWERISLFLSRPSIAIVAVAFLIIINLLIYTYSNSSAEMNSIQNLQASSDEYSLNNSLALFDFENLQP
jgi:hypothetical protein